MSGANLRLANLTAADLSETTFYDANMRSAALEGADLSGAILYGADIDGAAMPDGWRGLGAALVNTQVLSVAQCQLLRESSTPLLYATYGGYLPWPVRADARCSCRSTATIWPAKTSS